jgi:hypothetical protein
MYYCIGYMMSVFYNINQFFVFILHDVNTITYVGRCGTGPDGTERGG